MHRALATLVLTLAVGSGSASDVASAKTCPCMSLLLLVDPDPVVSGKSVEIKAYLTRSEAGEPMSPYRGAVVVELEGSALPQSLKLTAERDAFDRYVVRVQPTRPGQLFIAVTARNAVFRGPVAWARYSYEVIGAHDGSATSASTATLDVRRSGLILATMLVAAAAATWLRWRRRGVRGPGMSSAP
jgi:hypothetical protein